MANILYDNCFISNYKTFVREVKEEEGYYWHYLDETIFYVASGGMQSDEGLINQHKVLRLKKEGNKVWHLLKVRLEGKVELSIDFHLRFANAQTHTAQHLISGILEKIYGNRTLSHHVHGHYNDIEIEMEEMSIRQMHEIQVIVNGLIRDDLSVSIFYPTKKEAMRYQIKNSALLDEIRMVKIGNIGIDPCGCIHVPSLRYLQMIKITGFEKSSKGIKLRYVCGDQLLNNYERYFNELTKASTLLAQPFDFIEVGILKLMQDNKGLQADIMIFREKYISLMISTFPKDQSIYQEFNDIDLRTFMLLCAKFQEMKTQFFIFMWKQNNRVHVYVGNHTHSDQIFKQIADAYKLNGGGNEAYAQGGGLYKEGLSEWIVKVMEDN